MKNKKIIIFIIIIFLIFLISFVMFKNIDKNQVNYDYIKEKMNNKENILIYVTVKNKSECSNCSIYDEVINFYSEVYDLHFVYYYTDINKDSDFNKLLKEFEFNESGIVKPAVIFIKKGQLMGVANEMAKEDLLKQYLQEFGFINNKNLKIEKEVTDEEFNSIYEGSEESLIFVSSGNILDRKKVYNIAKDNHLNYYIVYSGITSYMNGYNKLLDSTNHNLTSPSLLIVKRGEVVDYVNFKTANDIEEFLGKNKMIKS